MRNPPKATVIVAARNEQENILSCLEALANQQFSAAYEVWVGDDASTDQTKALVERFIKDKPNFHLHEVEQNTMLIGKANVLAQLCDKAQGEVLAFTDADVVVPPSWLACGIEHCRSDQTIVTGFTVPEPSSVWAAMQYIDWIVGLKAIKAASDIGIPVTTMGNNMFLWRHAYESIGGYSGIPFSLTEDYAIFRALVDKGHRFVNLAAEGVTAFTKPIASFAKILHQRKRWMFGGMSLPLPLLMGSMAFALVYLTALVGIFIFPCYAAAFFGLKMLMEAILISDKAWQHGKLWSLLLLPLYELYVLAVYTGMVLFYFLPIQVNWKGRRYENA